MNKLTERLTAEGYDADHYPEYVRIPPSNYWKDRKDPLNNFEGGYIYIRGYVDGMTFETPCGLLVKGRNTFDNAIIGGNEYIYENDCALIHCPKYCKGRGCDHCVGYSDFCPVHPTDREYIEAGSVEEIARTTKEKIEEEKQEFIESHGGRVCENHMRYKDGAWEFNYSPETCKSSYCPASTYGGYCSVLGRELTKAKGNIYYDLEIEGRDYSKDGTFFEGERFHTVKKGIQLYDKPINLDLAKIIAKNRKMIEFRVRYSREIDPFLAFRADQGLVDWSYKIVNIRAEKKAVRDLDQDLEDIENGIQVVHAFDVERKKKEEKTEKRREAQEKRAKAAEKEIKRKGWDNMTEHEQKRARKLFEESYLRQIIAESRKKKPEQLSIFDFLEGVSE